MISAQPSGARRAVVLGGSMAGLLAARVLSETFAEVVVVDRDDLDGTGPRKGVPQGLHAHGILAKGREVIEDLFPGLTTELTDAGAVAVDIHNDIGWYNSQQPTAQAPSDLIGLCVSRPTLEDHIRGRVRRLPTVELRGGYEAIGLVATEDRSAVTGVTLVRVGGDGTAEHLAADLVVDATGRGNRSTTWLGQLGYALPREDIVNAGIAYATRQYARREPLPSGAAAVLNTLSSTFPYSFVLLPIEGDRWILTLIGMGGDIPPTDVDGFDAFARRLPIADLQAVVGRAEPLTEPRRFRIPASVRRRYELLTRLPQGYLVTGDALCAFNPVYGQGMSVAAVEASVLRDCLRSTGALTDLPRRFYQQAARVIDIPWDMAVGGDLAIPSVQGRRTLKIRILNAYVAKVLRAAETDPQVGLAFHRVVNLTNRPESLFAPGLLRRVLFPHRSAPVATSAPASVPAAATNDARQATPVG